MSASGRTTYGHTTGRRLLSGGIRPVDLHRPGGGRRFARPALVLLFLPWSFGGRRSNLKGYPGPPAQCVGGPRGFGSRAGAGCVARSAGCVSSTGGVGPGVLVGGGIHAWLRPARPGPGRTPPVAPGTPSLRARVRSPDRRAHGRAGAVLDGLVVAAAGTGGDLRGLGHHLVASDRLCGVRGPGTCPGSRQSRRSTPRRRKQAGTPTSARLEAADRIPGTRGPRPDHGPSEVTGPGSARRPRHGRWATTHTSSRRAGYPALPSVPWVLPAPSTGSPGHHNEARTKASRGRIAASRRL